MKKLNLVILVLIVVLGCKQDDSFLHAGDVNKKTSSSTSIDQPLGYWATGVGFIPIPEFPLQTRRDILWGVNSHTMRPYSQYTYVSLEYQINCLKTLGASIYRVDYRPQENSNPTLFNNLLNALQDNNMECLPVILINGHWRENNINIGNDWNNKRYNSIKNKIILNNSQGRSEIKNLFIWNHYYEQGEIIGQEFANTYGDKIKYYGIDNEIAQHIVSSYLHSENDLNNDGIPDQGNNMSFFYTNYGGYEMEHFFTCEEYAKRTIASAAFCSGMIDGIKSINSSAECVITENRVNFGYLEFLEYMGVNYDIVGYNYYGANILNYDAGNPHGYFNLYGELTTVGKNKPIWITEINRYHGSYPNNNETEDQSVKMRTYLEQLYKLELPNIKAIIEYELIDRHGYSNDNLYNQNFYGLLTIPPGTSEQNAILKPAFNTFRYSIEEFNYGYDDFFYSYYKKYVGREVDLLNPNAPNNPIGYWSGQLMNGGNREQILEYMIKNDCKSFIKEAFFKLLGVQNPSQEALDYYWSVVNDDNLPFESVIADIVSSDQFYNQAQAHYSSSPYYSENFIRYAFLKLTEGTYAPTNAEILQIYNTYPNLSNNRVQRRTIARNIIMEKDAYKIRVLINQFQNLLDKPNPQPQDEGIQYHLNNYVDQKNMIKRHLLSTDFWKQSIFRGYNYRQQNQ